jgi:hypothetical protein
MKGESKTSGYKGRGRIFSKYIADHRLMMRTYKNVYRSVVKDRVRT